MNPTYTITITWSELTLIIHALDIAKDALAKQMDEVNWEFDPEKYDDINLQWVALRDMNNDLRAKKYKNA